MGPRFSERVGAVPAQGIQLDGMNSPLRNSIWNFVVKGFDPNPIDAIAMIGIGFFKFPVHQLPTYAYHAMMEWFWERYESLPWHSVYDLIEFVADNSRRLPHPLSRQDFERLTNELLTQELSGYRFIQGTLTAITAPSEIEAIEQAATGTRYGRLTGVRTHIATAIKLLGQRPSPDYRNSIKESISAVESATKAISGVSGGGLDAALKELATHTPIHGALRDGLLKLYGYTSNADGIRHAMMEDSKAGFDEAKFMLVACSAAVNFLISKANDAGLLKK